MSVGRHAACISLLAIAITGCAADRNDALGPDLPHGARPPGGVAVNGVEHEWAIGVDIDEIRSGPVRFTFANTGTIVHEMLIVKTEIPVGGLPVDPSSQRFSEESDQYEVVDEIPEYEPGTIGDLTLDLAPGAYQLVCNLPGHYANGMAVAFHVTP
jgi:hypothetical protein